MEQPLITPDKLEQCDDIETIAPPEPIARVQDEFLDEMPEGLYIPPDSLTVFLESFEGPLDLLLYLIQRQNINILDIPIAAITRQYLEYVEIMKELHLDLAAEYLVMAAVLTEIKSRMILPVREGDDAVEDDPRAELVRQLQEYARIKQAADTLTGLPCVGRDILPASVEPPQVTEELVIPDIPLNAILHAMRGVMSRAALFSSHQVTREPLSVRERMTTILADLQHIDKLKFESLFVLKEGKAGVVVTLLAILELAKESLIQVVQLTAFGNIEVFRLENTLGANVRGLGDDY
ncbi:ScpA family protein [Candidatus Albibeggiatoa sp. nov. BB20]|uniref:segregation and condensation protein A n=1 Tax=Candidatus Albibeggiatoa sp. nov. BB20 TaxID=3162723 RepID=UPI0033658069